MTTTVATKPQVFSQPGNSKVILVHFFLSINELLTMNKAISYIKKENNNNNNKKKNHKVI